MVTPEESQTYWNTSDTNHMSFLQPGRNHNMPFFPPSGITSSALPGLNTSRENAVKPLLNNDISHGTANQCLKDSQSLIAAPQKRFIIFDHSGNQTRLFFSPSFSARKSGNGPLGANLRSVKAPFSETGRVNLENDNGPSGETGRANQELLMESITEEKWDENHPNDEEGEDGTMLEDSKEIDALFYSDSDYVDDDDGDDDEVTSPLTVEDGYNNENDKPGKELITEQVASSDSSPKKRKLLDSKYKKSQRSINSYYDDEEIDSSKMDKKVKIRRALKVLESTIPGLKGTDPLSILDQAIAYMKSMRNEAEALGLSYPRGKPPYLI